MAITSRALAFASRWFDDATVRRTFEPLIADWQREWLDAPPRRRALVTVRASLAFICAVIVSSPQIALTPAPRDVTHRIAVRMVRFMAVATSLLMIPPVIELGTWMSRGASWTRWSLFFFAVPGAITLAFPFAMTGAADSLRRHQDLPGHVMRSALLKLGAFAVMFMVIYGGWVVPAANQASRTAMNPPGMGAPLRGMRELTTFELITHPTRATIFAPGTLLSSRSTSLRRELNSRAMLTVLPVVLIWLRWRAYNLPRHRWFRVLPAIVATMASIGVMAACGAAGAWLEREAYLPIGSTYWLPIATFVLWGALTHHGAQERTVRQGT